MSQIAVSNIASEGRPRRAARVPMRPWHNASGLVRHRVFGVGVPHTGTSTLATLLRALGCATLQGLGVNQAGPGLSTHFLERVWGVSDAKQAVDKAYDHRRCQPACRSLFVEEAARWQCHQLVE